MSIEELQLGAPLGDGASGDVFASRFQGAPCIVPAECHRQTHKLLCKEHSLSCCPHHTNAAKLQPQAGRLWHCNRKMQNMHAALSQCVSIAAGHEVAVKVFKGEASPDGRAADEIDVTCAVAHPNLIRVIGLVQQPHALVVHKV